MDGYMIDPQLLLDWLKSDDSTIQKEALDQICNVILFCDNVDRLFEQLSPRTFIPALASLFVKYKKLDDENLKKELEQANEQVDDATLAARIATQSDKDYQKFQVLETSARALTNFFDVSATCSKRLVQVSGSLKAMSNYILTADLHDRSQKDLAEQLIKAFEFVSSREPDELYKSGGLRAVLKLIKRGRTNNGRSLLFSDTVTSAMNIINRLVSKFRPSDKKSDSNVISDEAEDIHLLADLALHNSNKTTAFACLKCVNSILSQLARNSKELPTQLTDVKSSNFARELIQFVIYQLKCSVNDDENENNDSFSKHNSSIGSTKTPSKNVDSFNLSTATLNVPSNANQLSCTVIATLVNLIYTLITQCKDPESNLKISIQELDFSYAIQVILLYHRDNRAKQDVTLLVDRLVEFFTTTDKSFKNIHLRIAQVHQKSQKDLIDTIKSKDVEGLIDVYDGEGYTLEDENGLTIFNWCVSFGSPEMVQFIGQVDKQYLTPRILHESIIVAVQNNKEDNLAILLSFKPDLTFRIDESSDSISDIMETFKSKSSRCYKLLTTYNKNVSKNKPKDEKESEIKKSESTPSIYKEPLSPALAAEFSLQILETLLKVTDETPELKNQLVFLQAIEKMMTILSKDEILNIGNKCLFPLKDDNIVDIDKLSAVEDVGLNMDINEDSIDKHSIKEDGKSIGRNQNLELLAEIINKCIILEEEDFNALIMKKISVDSEKSGGEKSKDSSSTPKRQISSTPFTSISSKSLSKRTFLKTNSGSIVVPMEQLLNVLGGSSSSYNLVSDNGHILQLPSGLALSLGTRNKLTPNREENRDNYQLHLTSLALLEMLMNKIKNEFSPIILKIGLVSKLTSLSKFYNELNPHPFKEIEPEMMQNILDRESVPISSPKVTLKMVGLRILSYMSDISEQFGFLSDNATSVEFTFLKNLTENCDKLSFYEILNQLSTYQYSVFDLISSNILIKLNQKLEKLEMKQRNFSKRDDLSDIDEMSDEDQLYSNIEKEKENIDENKNFKISPTLIKMFIKTLESSEKIPTYPFTGLDADSKPVLAVQKLENLRYMLRFEIERHDKDVNNVLKNYKKTIKIEPMVIGQNLKNEIFTMVRKQWFEYPRSSLTFLTRHESKQVNHVDITPFDKNGLIYYLGTNGKKSESSGWINPIDKNIIYATTNFGYNLEFGDISDFIDRSTTVKNVHTKNVPNCWVALDLGIEVQPTAYTLRNARGYQKSAIRNWKFQGSNDCEEWSTLRHHSNDNSITNNSGSTKTWKLNNKTSKNGSFRYFRIYSTGPNSSTEYHSISISGIEIYGKITNEEILEWPGLLETKIHKECVKNYQEFKKDLVAKGGSETSEKLKERMKVLERYNSVRLSMKGNKFFEDDYYGYEDGEDYYEDEDESFDRPNIKDTKADDISIDDEIDIQLADIENLQKSATFLKQLTESNAKSKSKIPNTLTSNWTKPKETLLEQTASSLDKNRRVSTIDDSSDWSNVENEKSDSDKDKKERRNKSNFFRTNFLTKAIKAKNMMIPEIKKKISEKSKERTKSASTSDVTKVVEKELYKNSTTETKSSNQLYVIKENQSKNEIGNLVVSLPEINDDRNLLQIDKEELSNQKATTTNCLNLSKASKVELTSSNSKTANSVPCLKSFQKFDKNTNINENPIKRASNTNDIPADICEEDGLETHKRIQGEKAAKMVRNDKSEGMEFECVSSSNIEEDFDNKTDFVSDQKLNNELYGKFTSSTQSLPTIRGTKISDQNIEGQDSSKPSNENTLQEAFWSEKGQKDLSVTNIHRTKSRDSEKSDKEEQKESKQTKSESRPSTSSKPTLANLLEAYENEKASENETDQKDEKFTSARTDPILNPDMSDESDWESCYSEKGTVPEKDKEEKVKNSKLGEILEIKYENKNNEMDDKETEDKNQNETLDDNDENTEEGDDDDNDDDYDDGSHYDYNDDEESEMSDFGDVESPFIRNEDIAFMRQFARAYDNKSDDKKEDKKKTDKDEKEVLTPNLENFPFPMPPNFTEDLNYKVTESTPKAEKDKKEKTIVSKDATKDAKTKPSLSNKFKENIPKSISEFLNETTGSPKTNPKYSFLTSLKQAKSLAKRDGISKNQTISKGPLDSILEKLFCDPPPEALLRLDSALNRPWVSSGFPSSLLLNRSRGTSSKHEHAFSSGHTGRIVRERPDLLRPFDPRPRRQNVPQTYKLKIPVAKVKKNEEGSCKNLSESTVVCSKNSESGESSLASSQQSSSVNLESSSSLNTTSQSTSTSQVSSLSKNCDGDKIGNISEAITIPVLSKKQETVNLKLVAKFEEDKPKVEIVIKNDETILSAITRAYERCYNYESRLCSKNVKLLQDLFSSSNGASMKLVYSFDNVDNLQQSSIISNSMTASTITVPTINKKYKTQTVGLDKNAIICIKLLNHLYKQLIKNDYTSNSINNLPNQMETEDVFQTTESTGSAFLSPKISSKVRNQITDGVAATCSAFSTGLLLISQKCPFLLSEDLRLLYVKLAGSGFDRGVINYQNFVHHEQDSAGNISTGDIQDSHTRYINALTEPSDFARIRIHKATVNRASIYKLEEVEKTENDKMNDDESKSISSPKEDKNALEIYQGIKFLDEATRVFKAHSGLKSKLEFEFKGEAGTGLGPTIEYYNECCRNLRLKNLGIWIDRSTDTDLYHVEKLFPKPCCYENNSSENLSHFWLLGNILGKVVLDNRIVDLPISYAFLNLILSYSLKTIQAKNKSSNTCDDTVKDAKKEIKSFNSIERNLYLTYLQEIEPTRAEFLKELGDMNSKDIENLYLNFTFNNEQNEIVPNGSKIDVTFENKMEYIDNMLYFILNVGIFRQLRYFVKGFETCLPIINLYTLSAGSSLRLKTILTGHEIINWSINDLLEHIEPKLGYTKTSQLFINLCEVLIEFTNDERKRFLKFLTGCSSLPPGGLKNLQPKMTVVKKTPENVIKGKSTEETINGIHPSVNTCQHYLKLPAYSSKQFLKERLLAATFETGFYFN